MLGHGLGHGQGLAAAGVLGEFLGGDRLLAAGADTTVEVEPRSTTKYSWASHCDSDRVRAS